MKTSRDLEASLERIRALRAASAQPKTQSFTRLHAVGLGFGLLLGGAAFLYGAGHPSKTLPATPVVTPEPVLAAQPAADWRSKISQADASQLVQPAPVAAPEPEPVPAPQPQMRYTEAGALAEMCAAGRQYREDVDTGFAQPSQARVEVQLYAKYLSEQSPASVGQLVRAGNDGLWLDRC